jgi:hypothetical protein
MYRMREPTCVIKVIVCYNDVQVKTCMYRMWAPTWVHMHAKAQDVMYRMWAPTCVHMHAKAQAYVSSFLEYIWYVCIYVFTRSRSHNFILGTNKSTKKDGRVARTPACIHVCTYMPKPKPTSHLSSEKLYTAILMIIEGQLHVFQPYFSVVNWY